VRVLSKEVFGRLQAPFREALALDALLARDKVVREEARLDLERARTAEQARRALMAEEEQRIHAQRQRDVEKRAHDDDLARQALEAHLAREHQTSEAQRLRASIELALKREAAELEAELERQRRAGVPDLSEARLQEMLLTTTMPRIAEAFRGSFDKVNVTTTDGSALGFLTSALNQVLAMAPRNTNAPTTTTAAAARNITG
jgi:hypothetical protein